MLYCCNLPNHHTWCWGVVKKRVVLPSYQYWNHCYCVGENQPPSWMLEPLYFICDGIFFRVLRSYQIIASFLLHWIGQSLLLLLHFPLSIIIWEDHKLFQINQSQPSYSSFYFNLNLFFLTRVFCVNIHCQELEFVGVQYY